MPNTSVRAAAEGLPNYPRNPHRFSFFRKLLKASASRAGSEPGRETASKESFMNQHVNRRSVVAASAGVAGIAVALAGLTRRAETEPVGRVTVDPKLRKLEAAFNAEWKKYLAILPAHDAAEARWFEARQHTAQDGAAWRAAEDEFTKHARLFRRQLRSVGVASERILRVPACSLADMQVKLRVHRKWFFEDDDLVRVIAADIARVAKLQRQALKGVSRGTAAVTA